MRKGDLLTLLEERYRFTAVQRNHERWCFWAIAYQCACNQVEDDTFFTLSVS